jgi:pullulanase/glycogen debranching enzyme
MKKIFYCIIFMLCHFLIEAQPNGFEHSNDTTTFIFNPSDYGVTVKNKVILGGEFNNWGNSANPNKWIMRRQMGNFFTLKIYNPNFEIIKPNSEFKFRMDNGKWLSPPAAATNTENGSLIFMKGAEQLGVTASLLNPNNIKVKVTGLPSQTQITDSSIILTNLQGKQIRIKSTHITAINSHNKQNYSVDLEIFPTEELDKKRIYYLQIPALKLKTAVNFDGWFANLKSNKELGATILENGTQTSFRVFAPRANLVKLYLYKPTPKSKNYFAKIPYQTIDLVMDEQGIWETIIDENLEGVWYNYTAHGIKEIGNFFYENNPIHLSDPYARVVMEGTNTCMVTAKTKPATALKNGIPKMNDLVLYSTHIQDFTNKLPLYENLKGTFTGMGTSHLTNKKNQPIGFDYLVNLGINGVALMPIQEMYNWPKDEWNRKFGKDPLMREQEIANNDYNQGNFISHAFAIESQYRQKDTKPGDERIQFRDLIQKFHNKNIAVIIDMAWFQTAENLNEKSPILHFAGFDKQYYYRSKNFDQFALLENEIKTENRYMVQRWIIDQCKHLITEFGVDGFKIKMAQLTDYETLKTLKAALPENIILIAEPWGKSIDPLFNKNLNWDKSKQTLPISFLNSKASAAYIGNPIILAEKNKHRGWAGGNMEERNLVIDALNDSLNYYCHDVPVNYLDIYNNYSLADQFGTTNFDGRFGVDEANYKIASTLLFTTPGAILINGGSEFMHSKGAAPLNPVTKEFNNTKILLGTKQNTSNLNKPNQLVWENIGKTKTPQNSDLPEAYTNCNYKNMLAFWQGLIALRTQILLPLINSNPKYIAQNLSDSKPINFHSLFQFILPENEKMLGYMIDNKILVLINNDNKPNSFETNSMNLKGRWKLIANSNEINLNGITQKTLIGNPIKANGICIWLKE